MLANLSGAVGAVFSVVILVGLVSAAHAGAADVLAVKADELGSVYNFTVTVRSEDTGWDDYADRIEVVAPDGTVLATRVLVHPHVAEQPFTRDIFGVKVPAGVDRVTVRAHHSQKGYDGATVTIELSR